MNILVTSSGRRVELVKLIKKVLEPYGGKVVVADAKDDAPTIKFSDAFVQIPYISSPDFIPTLLDICKRLKIDILIPTIDTELLVLSKNKKKFEDIGVLVNISESRVVEICRNKIKTSDFFAENNILAPKRVLSGEDARYPLFIKPLDGSSSINAFKINTPEEFAFFVNYVPNPIIQEMVVGDEYTIDVFCDFEAKPITVVPRQRIAVRSGEILKGRIVRDRELINAALDLIEKLKPHGHITLQCIKDGNGVYFIEINPRFGGGAPMSICAGANSIENLIKIKMGEKLSYNEDWRDNLTFSRFDDCVLL